MPNDQFIFQESKEVIPKQDSWSNEDSKVVDLLFSTFILMPTRDLKEKITLLGVWVYYNVLYAYFTQYMWVLYTFNLPINSNCLGGIIVNA